MSGIVGAGFDESQTSTCILLGVHFGSNLPDHSFVLFATSRPLALLVDVCAGMAVPHLSPSPPSIVAVPSSDEAPGPDHPSPLPEI